MGSQETGLDLALAHARSEQEQLRDRLRVVDEVIRYLKEAIADSMAGAVEEGPGAGHGAEGRFADKSAPEAAEIVLKERAKPMHLKEIAEAILAGGYAGQKDLKKLYANLYTTMTRRKAHVFRKVKGQAATFGLQAWIETDEKPLRQEPGAAL